MTALVSVERTASAVRWVPLAVLAGAIAFSLALASSAREGVFFTGDGGVKFALTRQFAEGDLHPDLRLPAEPWVQDLWQRGLYPLDPPFAYAIDGKRYVKDPVPFSLLNAPLYAALGWRGLYLVPLVALWATWVAFLLLCRRLAVPPLATAAALAAVAFASPLTLYGAMYWEHTLAVALAFGGLAILLEPDGSTPVPWRAVAGAALVGISAWFRSEHLLLAAVLGALALASRPLGLGVRRRGLVVAGLLAPILALLAANAAIYGHPLGAHGLQVAQSLGASVRVSNAFATAGALLRLLGGYFPIAIPAAVIAVVAMTRPAAPPARLLAWASVLYVLLLPAILPRPETGGEGGRQWGPRFLLVVVPMVCAMVPIALSRTLTRSPGSAGRERLKAFALAALAVAAAAGLWRNSWVGPRELRDDYATRMLPLLEAVRADRAVAVAASEQFAPQELMALSGEKRFFFVKTPEDLERLGAAVLAHGDGRYLFLSDQVVSGEGPFTHEGRRYQLRVRPLGRRGWRLVVHEVVASDRAGAPAPAAFP